MASPSGNEENAVLVENMEETIDLTGSIEAPIRRFQHSSLGQRIRALDFPGGSLLKEWFFTQREGLKPWANFANSQKFSKPLTLPEGSRRVVSNIKHFRGNYFYVVFGIAVFCLLTSPFLLITLCGSLGACYAVKMKNNDRKVVLMGKELSLPQQYAGVAMVSLPILWLAGAGNAFFWIIGASIVVIVMHALFHHPPPSDQDELFGVKIGDV